MRSLAALLLALATATVLADDPPDLASSIQRIDGAAHRERAVKEYDEEPPAGDERTIIAEDILPLLPSDLSTFLPAIRKIKNQECGRQAEVFLYGLHNLTSWAVQMFDASAKVPAGVLLGSTYSFGNFDECVEASAPLGAGNFRGKYCLARLQLVTAWQQIKEGEERKGIPKHILHLAFCIPSACSGKDLQDFLLEISFANHLSGFHVKIQVEEYMCQIKEEVNLDYKDIVFISVMAFFLLLLIVSSVYDFFTTENTKESQNKHPSVIREAVMAFSVPSNLKKLVKHTPSAGSLDCIFGIKLFSMLFILMGHCALFRSGGPVLNADFLQEAMDKVENGLLFNNQLFVDTFFLVSGFLISYHLLRELDKRKSVNVLILYIFRFIRLTPAYLAVLALYATVLYKMDSGPLWEARVGLERQRCLDSWWTNILYINNYVNTDNLCMFQSWFISVDTHLFMLAPLFIIQLYRRPVMGQVLLLLVTAVSIAVPFVITYMQSLDPLLMLYPREIKDISLNSMFLAAYIKTHMRATPYFCGMLLGYVLYRFQTSGRKLSKTLVCTGWVLAPMCALPAMFSVATFYSAGYQYSALEAAVYAAWDKVGWCLGSAWLIFACCTDNGGPLTKLLSWRPLIPLSRLTYCAYLSNGIIELHSAGTLRTPAYLSVVDYAKATLSHSVLTFSCALLLCLAFDSPVHALQTSLLRREKRTKETKGSKENASS